MKALLSACVRALRAQSISVESYITLNSDGSTGWFITSPDGRGSASYNVEPGARVVRAEPKEYEATIRQLEKSPERVQFEGAPAPNFQEPPENAEGWAFLDEDAASVLCHAIIGCENFASKEEARPNINCVHICRAEKGAGPAVVVATNGHVLNSYTFSEEIDLPPPAINHSLSRQTGGILNRFTVLDVAFCSRMAWFSGIDKDGCMVTFVDGHNDPNDVRYPDWRRVVGDSVEPRLAQEANPAFFLNAVLQHGKADELHFLTHENWGIQTAHALRNVKSEDAAAKVRDVLVERDVDLNGLLDNDPAWIWQTSLGTSTLPALKKVARFLLSNLEGVSANRLQSIIQLNSIPKVSNSNGKQVPVKSILSYYAK